MQQWVDDFIARELGAGCAERRAHNLRHLLDRFARWHDRRGLDPRDLTPGVIDEWWVSEEVDGIAANGRKLTSATKAGYRSNFNLFVLRYLDGQRKVHDPRGLAQAIARVKPRNRKRNWIASAEMDLALRATRHPWDRIVLALHMFTGRRQVELRGMRVADVKLATNEIRWWNSKSNREIVLPITPRLGAELRVWLAWYAEQCGPLTPGMYVIPARRSGGKGGSRYTFWPNKMHGDLGRIVGPYIEPYLPEGLRYDGKSHCLRRSAAHALLEHLLSIGHGDPLALVCAFLDHSSVTITERYLNVNYRTVQLSEILRGADFVPDPHMAGVADLSAARVARAAGGD